MREVYRDVLSLVGIGVSVVLLREVRDLRKKVDQIEPRDTRSWDASTLLGVVAPPKR